MSVLCCSIPDFLFALARRDEQGAEQDRPVVLIGADGAVWAASPLARAGGVLPGMTARQARARCPDAALRDLNLKTSQAAQDELLYALARSGLAVEAQDWGAAYVDLREAAAAESPDVSPLCAELGRQVRQSLGDALQPALGWDTGKFTARAAAAQCSPGRMRLVGRDGEARFLDPLPIALLPLPALALQQLDWLGIRTLGRFARLPAAAVQQRFGPAGKLAQQWAQGRDDRPVRATVGVQPEPIQVDLDAPTASQDIALDAAMRALKPQLKTMQARLEGCRRVRAELRFIDGGARALDRAFVEPVSAPASIRAALGQELARIAWPAELVGLQIALADAGELTPQQLALFPELDRGEPAGLSFAGLVRKLGPRHGRLFWRGQLVDGEHPVAERRFPFSRGKT